MPDTAGARHTLGLTQGLREIDIRRTIYELDPNTAPLTTISMRLPRRPTHNPLFQWAESNRRNRFDAVNNGAGYAAGATAIVVDAASKFAQYDLVKVTRTGEVMEVTAVNTGTNTLTVTRGVGASATGVAIVDNDEIIRIGSVEPEGALDKPAVSPNPTLVTNYTHIVRTPYDSTGTNRASTTYTEPSDWTYAANHAAQEHKIDWEWIFITSKKDERTDANGKAVRTTNGVLNSISTNVTDMGGGMTETEFFGSFRTAFRYGDKASKTLFASQVVLEAINTYPRGKIQVPQLTDGKTSYGLDVQRFISPFGNLTVVQHNLLEGTKYGGHAFILDLSKMARRPLVGNGEDRDTKIRENIHAPGYDGKKSEILTEQGLEFGQEQAHALLHNVTGAA